MKRTPFVAAAYCLRRNRHGRRGLFTAFLESMYRWHQERALLIVRDAALPTADETDGKRCPNEQRDRSDKPDIARPWLPH